MVLPDGVNVDGGNDKNISVVLYIVVTPHVLANVLIVYDAFDSVGNITSVDSSEHCVGNHVVVYGQHHGVWVVHLIIS